MRFIGMRFIGSLLILLVATTLIFAGTATALAAPPDPSIPQSPPLIPENISAPSRAESGGGMSPSAEELAFQSASQTLSNLPPLKAVLLVGPIDGDYGTWTEEEKAAA